jgi:hypothetical protein
MMDPEELNLEEWFWIVLIFVLGAFFLSNWLAMVYSQ